MSATAVFTYPTQKELREIEQEKLPVLTQDDPIFDDFPITEAKSWRLSWEQLDNYQGLQSVRGLDGQPGRVKMTGAKSYDFEPGVYGDFGTMTEKMLSEARELGSYDAPASLDTFVGRLQSLLLTRRIDRIRFIIWTLLTTGVFSIARDDGTILHTDVFPLKTFSAAVSWGTFATATPYADLRNIVLKQRGQSVDFAGGKLYMNQVSINNLLSNTNANDLFGRKAASGATLNSLTDINTIAAAQSLPTIIPYDFGYLSDGTDGNAAGTFIPFIPNGVAVLVGKRTNGANLGEYRMTRNANNASMEPGAYTRVIDHGEVKIPRQIDVHDGHNGGPVIFFPGSVVVMTI